MQKHCTSHSLADNFRDQRATVAPCLADCILLSAKLARSARQLTYRACRLNLASFVTTWMEPEAEKLIAESLNVNFVDMVCASTY